jgi:trimeric autotransporter adhesin
MVARHLRFSFVVILFSFYSATAQLRLVKDFAASIDSTYGSDPAFLTEFNNGVIFSARHNTSGVELWYSNGTKEGTILITDINPVGNSYPSNPLYYSANAIPLQNGELPFAKLDDKIFFVANDGVHGFELWESDGTPAGTRLVKDIYPGFNSSSIKWMLVMGSALYFSANDGVAGEELWKSDGTLSGTVLFKDINVGPASGSPVGLTLLENKFVFAADNGTTGSEPWISDGNPASTFLLVDAFPGSSAYSAIEVFGKDSQFYIGKYPTLIKSNGTPEGTTVLPSALEGGLRAVYNNTAFYSRVNEEGKLYYTNGSASGYYTLYEPMENVQYSDPYCAVVGGELFFGYGYSDFTAVSDESQYYDEGIEILKYDPEEDYFYQFASFNNSINVDEYREGCGVNNMILRDGKYYIEFYWAYGSILALKKPDPSSLLDPVANSLSGIYVAFIDDNILSSAKLMNFQYKEDWELFLNNSNGTLKLTDNHGTASSLFYNYATLNENLLFQVYTPDSPFTAYRSDGYTATVVGLPAWNEIIAVNGSLYFNLPNTADGLWKSDGTTATVLAAKDVFHLMSFNHELFFLVNDSGSGLQLWKTDGSAGGDVMVKELNEEFTYSSIMKHVVFDQHLLFTVANADGTSALWRTDGSSNGTTLIKNFGYAYDGFNFFIFKEQVYFNVVTGSYNNLWRTDGTLSGTEVVVENASENGALMYPLASNDSYLFYFMSGPGLGNLYSFDGNASQVLTSGSIYGGVYDLKFVSAGKAIFSKGVELWVTEGTPETTTKIHEFSPQLSPRSPMVMKVVDGKAILNGIDVEHGHEIWISDGTGAGTKFLLEINEGDDSSYPQNLTQVDDQLFIEASTDELGGELWAINISPSMHVVHNEEEIENNETLEFSSVDMDLDILNSGLFDLLLSDFVIDGANKELFQVIQPETSTLSYDSLTSLHVTFIPEEAGQKNATLTLKSNDANTPDFIINLKATVEVTGTEGGIADVNLYPNPSNGLINIRSRLPLQKVSCFDLAGRELTHEIIQSNGDQSTLVVHSKGLILLKIQTGNKTVVQKVIVK